MQYRASIDGRNSRPSAMGGVFRPHEKLDASIFSAALKKAGVEHELVLVTDAPHSFHLQPKQRDLRTLVLNFFDKHLKRK